jgi:hypothetical protein
VLKIIAVVDDTGQQKLLSLTRQLIAHKLSQSQVLSQVIATQKKCDVLKLQVASLKQINEKLEREFQDNERPHEYTLPSAHSSSLEFKHQQDMSTKQKELFKAKFDTLKEKTDHAYDASLLLVQKQTELEKLAQQVIDLKSYHLAEIQLLKADLEAERNRNAQNKRQVDVIELNNLHCLPIVGTSRSKFGQNN